MRYLIILLLSLISVSCFCQDSIKAKKVIKNNFKVIDDYLKDNNSDTNSKRIQVIIFFENLTGIPSTSATSYIGKASPSIKDIQVWREWYFINSANIFWDDKTKTIVLHKVIKPPVN